MHLGRPPGCGAVEPGPQRVRHQWCRPVHMCVRNIWLIRPTR